MTVRELIEELSNYPEEDDVYIASEDTDMSAEGVEPIRDGILITSW